MKRSTKHIALVATALACLWAPSLPAFSCFTPTRDHFDDFDVIFVGRAVKMGPAPAPFPDDGLQTHFQVIHVYRGSLDSYVPVVTSRHGLIGGYVYAIGKEYVVLATEEMGHYWSGMCRSVPTGKPHSQPLLSDLEAEFGAREE